MIRPRRVLCQQGHRRVIRSGRTGDRPSSGCVRRSRRTTPHRPIGPARSPRPRHRRRRRGSDHRAPRADCAAPAFAGPRSRQRGLPRARVVITQRGSGIAIVRRAVSPIDSVRPTQPFSTNPLSVPSTMMFIRNRSSSKRVPGWRASSWARVEVVSTDTGKTSRNEPGGTGEGMPTMANKAAPSRDSVTVSRGPSGSRLPRSGWY